MTQQELMSKIIARISADKSATASSKELRVATAKLLSEVQQFNQKLAQPIDLYAGTNHNKSK